eukprot:5300383-Pyramimonas_sp.AAC.1
MCGPIDCEAELSDEPQVVPVPKDSCFTRWLSRKCDQSRRKRCLEAAGAWPESPARAVVSAAARELADSASP